MNWHEKDINDDIDDAEHDTLSSINFISKYMYSHRSLHMPTNKTYIVDVTTRMLYNMQATA